MTGTRMIMPGDWTTLVQDNLIKAKIKHNIPRMSSSLVFQTKSKKDFKNILDIVLKE